MGGGGERVCRVYNTSHFSTNRSSVTDGTTSGNSSVELVEREWSIGLVRARGISQSSGKGS